MLAFIQNFNNIRLKQKNISSFMYPSMTFDWGYTSFDKYLCLHQNISTHRNFYQKLFINECARKEKSEKENFKIFPKI